MNIGTFFHSLHLPYFASPIPATGVENQKIGKEEGQRTYSYNKLELSNWKRIGRFLTGLGAFVLTLGFGFGVGFLSTTLRKKISRWYEECRTGIRQVKYINMPSSVEDSETIHKVNRVAEDQIQNPTKSPANKNISQFIDQARKQITSLSSAELESGYKIALNRVSDLSAEEKTTLLTVSEKVAQTYIKNHHFIKAFEIRMRTAQAISPAEPLANFHLNLAKAHPKLGLHLQPLNTSLFKNHTLAIYKREYGKDKPHQLHVCTKLNHSARAQIQSSLNWIKAHPKELLKVLPEGFCTGVSVQTEDCIYQGRIPIGSKSWEGPFSTNIGSYGYKLSDKILKPVQVIDFKGVGKIKIGNNLDILSEYNKLSIELEPGLPDDQAAAKLNILFATLGLGVVSATSRSEDIARIKIMQLFRAYYPKEAHAFEREAKSFEESIDSLQARIEAQVPDMKDKFKHYLIDHPELIYQQEVYPGQFTWSIKGLAQEAREAGALGLMAGVGNAGESAHDASKMIISILKLGALSTQDRFQMGITAQGVSAEDDLRSGGAESVFTRMITQGMQNLKIFAFQGKMQVLYDLDLVERVGFAYSKDKFGSKKPKKYQKRFNIVNLVKQIETNPAAFNENEVCIRNRVAPQFIKAIKVESDKDKAVLIAALKSEGLVTKKSGKEVINGIPLDKFIVVGPFFKAEYWN